MPTMAVITTGSHSTSHAATGTAGQLTTSSGCQQVRLVQLVLNTAQVSRPSPASIPSSPATGWNIL